MTAILGLGANLGDTEKTLCSAIECIDRLPGVRVMRTSSLYDTAPVETPDEQPDYMNMVAEVETTVAPHVLLGMCLGIESAHMRLRPHEKAARTLDIDLLICAENDRILEMNTPDLVLPHPRMMFRGFVLTPLKELFPSGKAFDLDFEQPFIESSSQRVMRIGEF